MDTQKACTGSVLIIEANESISVMMATVLGHEGFKTQIAVDSAAAAAVLARTRFDAIVRDVNLVPVERAHTLAELAATPPDLLRRTIIATTARGEILKKIPDSTVFAVITKPFDLRELVEVTTACVRRFRGGPDGGGKGDFEAVRRFVTEAPKLQRLLDGPDGSPDELILRARLRETVRAISTTLLEAAAAELVPARAKAFRAASTIAAALAADAPRRLLVASRDH
jgi:DNA-binding response OmpR family regulator